MLTFLSNTKTIDLNNNERHIMAKKLGYNDISTEIGTFIDVTREAFDSYSYAAGALQAQLAFALSQLPAHKQQETLRVLAGLAAKYSTK
jgi:hypothetical protein